jgi:hypothetical protein
VEKALQSVYDGLNATGRKQDWGLSRWPGTSITTPNPFSGSRKDFTVAFELVNERQQVIGRQSLTLGNRWSFSANREKVSIDFTENNFQTVTFNAVNANDITNALTIRVASVNGVKPQTALQAGSLRLAALSTDEWALNNKARYSRGLLGGIEGASGDFVIPAAIWGDPVTSIGDGAFQDNRKLTSLTIPNSVTTIGERAFLNAFLDKNEAARKEYAAKYNSMSAFDRLLLYPARSSYTLIIPDSVTNIGKYAFFFKQKTADVIPMVTGVQTCALPI